MASKGSAMVTTDAPDSGLLSRALTAVKKGDFSVRLPVDQTGITGKIYDTLNDIIELNDLMTKEIGRVSRVVGQEGKTSQRASRNGSTGGWASCIDSVNSLIADLAQPTTEMARVISAVADGNLSQRMSMEVGGRVLTGEFLQTARTVNTMVDQLNAFASEVTRVAREVGTEGKLGGQAAVPGVAGTWKDLTDSVNMMAGNLTGQVRNIAEVATAIAKGDLSKKITVDVRGEILELKNTINTMVDQLSTFASEVTRVAREVGSEGRLGGQAAVEGVLGTWRDLTDSVNMMAGNLTVQLRDVSKVATAIASGDLGQKITVEVKGEILDIKDVINRMVDQLNSFASEVTRVAREVGTEGKLGGQAQVSGVAGTWKDLTDSVNMMAGNLTVQLRDVSKVATAIASGDLGQKITVEVKGEILEIKDVINRMVDQLGTFASEVTRVALEVGTEGKLGGQAAVPGVAGTWKDLTDSVNMMAGNLTAQVRNIAEVATGIAKGDLSTKITVDVRGEFLQLKETINTMVDQLNAFASEVTRVAQEVATEGKLGGQAEVWGVAGTWKDLTDSVNMMAGNLTAQVRNIAEVATAIANGDLSRKITVDVRGEILDLKNTINTMVDQLNSFAAEVTRVAREVGTEGKLGGQAAVEGVSGTWRDLTDSVNMMAGNLTVQLRDVSKVATTIANGDLGQKITVEVKGEILEIKDVINRMVDQLNSFANEVTRVAREVGTEGKLGGQAAVPGVAGTWKDLTDNVNFMANNLTDQVRNTAGVITAVANGDLAKKITVEVKGEMLDLKNTINTMVDQLNAFVAEVTRVAREVGTEGKLGGQAAVPGVAGAWKDLTDSVNMMAGNLTVQLRDVSKVATAIANGDLGQKVTVEVKGEILEIKDVINRMVDQLGSFASEVTRVAREVGAEGKLGVQAEVRGVAGIWMDLTDSVNMMAGNLTSQVRNIAEVATAIASGDLSKKITVDVRGEILQLKETINTMVEQLRSFASEVTRVAREVGSEGRLGGQAFVPGVGGTWKDLTDNVNSMANNLTDQVRNTAGVITAVANGDLAKKITVEVKGEMLDLKNTINTMVDQLNAFAAEVTRVAREVGTDGKLGGQAQVRGVSGVWKDLTDNVNFMANNLTDQVRGIAKVVTSVASGDLRQKLTVQARGEIAQLADTINNMIDTLATFADQVTTVAREVGVEGRLGGQAAVPGAAGTWKDLTDNVNRLAANLSTQVRAIAEVATAVTKGDLSRSITVEAMGEVATLKDNVNQMISNLRDTTKVNTEQDWLKTNLTRFTRLLQGQRDLATVAQVILSELAPLVNMQHGIFYLNEPDSQGPLLKLFSSFGYQERKHISSQFRVREGLIGQCAFEKQRILLQEVPQDYVKISSGLGESTPLNIVLLPVVFEGEVLAIIELASFVRFNEMHQAFFDQLVESIGIVLNTIAATARTEELLKQSQSLAGELQGQQEELRETNKRLEEQANTLQESERRLKDQQEELQQANEELEERAELMATQTAEVERKNREIELARQALEEKAEQLALTSKYKSEFLANMSHELRTPLNSMLILSQQLADNSDRNLTTKQVEQSKTVHQAGSDLLGLINDILDLSKIESGTIQVDVIPLPFTQLVEVIETTFNPVAENKGLSFNIELAPGLPSAIHTDEKRLQQVLKNLLSNAFKFTEKGKVSMRIEEAKRGWNADQETLNRAEKVFAFMVSDTGIGIPGDKQKIIFEAFQQADGTTSRKYGGTGLGLAISREIATMLGGELRLVKSEPDKGSIFTLYLPQRYTRPPARPRTEKPAGAPGSRVDPLSSPRGSTMLEVLLPPEVGQVSELGPPPPAPSQVKDDRSEIQKGDRVVLIVEDDIPFARILLDMARERGFKGVIALAGEEALKLAKRFNPHAITLDIRLPDMDGYVLLDRFKHDARTLHVPIHIISVTEDPQRSLTLGAVAHLQKPVTKAALDEVFARIQGFVERGTKNLLVVEDDEVQRQSIVDLLGNGDIRTLAVGSGAEALEALKAQQFDCMVLDLGLPDMTGVELIKKIRKEASISHPPIIVYTGKELTKKEETDLRGVSETIIVKDVKSPERLLAETALFLHRVEASLPEPKRLMLERARKTDPVLTGKKVLVVDDDIRNIFALTSVLESYDIQVVYAENGRDGIDLLRKTPGIDVVLMDIMMPEMDGYEATRVIRGISTFQSLPIIALTAKAMKGDREKCIEAGASDYIAKPVDTEQLLSLLRVWLYR